MNEELEQLKKEMEIAQEADQKRFNDAPPDMGYQEFIDYMSVTSDRVSELGRKIRMLKEPTFSDLPDFGTVMSLNEFIECVKSGGFIDYDGYGYYVKDGKESDIVIVPSDLEANSIRKDFDQIIWFNR